MQNKKQLLIGLRIALICSFLGAVSFVRSGEYLDSDEMHVNLLPYLYYSETESGNGNAYLMSYETPYEIVYTLKKVPPKTRVSLYIPGDSVTELGRGQFTQGLSECPTSLTIADINNPAKLKKIAEFGVYQDTPNQRRRDIYWDAMTQSQFTGQPPVPIRDCVVGILQNADTGEVLNDKLVFRADIGRYSAIFPALRFTKNPVNGRYNLHYTFMSEINIKNSALVVSEIPCCNGAVPKAAFNAGIDAVINFFKTNSVCQEKYKIFAVAGPLQAGIENSGELEMVDKDGQPFVPITGHQYVVTVILESENDNVNTADSGFKEGTLRGKSGYVISNAPTGIESPTESNVNVWSPKGSGQLNVNAPECADGFCNAADVSGRELLRNQKLSNSGITDIPLNSYKGIVIWNVLDKNGKKAASGKTIIQ